ncbi:MAG: hypothetical protein OEW87_10030, partial [Flavobacteriaceae bacterium]|nr:hypothetical protein [Flavobacteriaceae bacterium]
GLGVNTLAAEEVAEGLIKVLYPDEKWEMKIPEMEVLSNGYLRTAIGAIFAGINGSDSNLRECFRRGQWAPTREELELKDKREVLLKEMHEWAKEQPESKVDWEDRKQVKYYPVYDHRKRKWNIYSACDNQTNFQFPHFTKKEKCQEMIDLFGEHMTECFVNQEL